MNTSWDQYKEAAEAAAARGDLATAESLWTHLLAAADVAGNHDARFALGLDSLGKVYSAQKRFLQAEAAYTKGIQVKEALFGPMSIEVAKTCNFLAAICYEQNKFEKTESLGNRALRIYQSLLGAEHPAVTTMANNLVRLRQKLGRVTNTGMPAANPQYQQQQAQQQQAQQQQAQQQQAPQHQAPQPSQQPSQQQVPQYAQAQAQAQQQQAQPQQQPQQHSQQLPQQQQQQQTQNVNQAPMRPPAPGVAAPAYAPNYQAQPVMQNYAQPNQHAQQSQPAPIPQPQQIQQQAPRPQIQQPQVAPNYGQQPAPSHTAAQPNYSNQPQVQSGNYSQQHQAAPPQYAQPAPVSQPQSQPQQPQPQYQTQPQLQPPPQQPAQQPMPQPMPQQQMQSGNYGQQYATPPQQSLNNNYGQHAPQYAQPQPQQQPQQPQPQLQQYQQAAVYQQPQVANYAQPAPAPPPPTPQPQPVFRSHIPTSPQLPPQMHQPQAAPGAADQAPAAAEEKLPTPTQARAIAERKAKQAEQVCEVCGRFYSGPGCMSCTQSLAPIDFGFDALNPKRNKDQR
ncbi:MAG: tetratricopeptide repeat protein [Leptolyngbya sp.]|nr:tetratricopeptide repeat protein [Candidatus Melainabacteria bacterium]